MVRSLNVYFHRDFDGVAGAAILAFALDNLKLFDSFEYFPVDYEIKASWKSMALRKPAAVLDFLYHADAEIYFDHHSTSFESQEERNGFKEDVWRMWDGTYKSTPSLIKASLSSRVDLARFEEMIHWSDVIDSAEYSSPREAYDFGNKFIALNRLIGHFNRDDQMLSSIVGVVLSGGVAEYVNEHRTIISKIESEEADALKRLSEIAVVEDGICFYDQCDEVGSFQRYGSYFFYPNADYTIAVFKRLHEFQVSIGYNPWKNENKVDLGEIAAVYSGGGRRNVAGIIKSTRQDALQVATAIRDTLKSATDRKFESSPMYNP